MTVTNAQRVIAANQANTIRVGITAAMMNVNRIRRNAAMTVTNAQRVIAANQANTIRLGITAAIMNVHRIRRSAAMTVPPSSPSMQPSRLADVATLLSLPRAAKSLRRATWKMCITCTIAFRLKFSMAARATGARGLLPPVRTSGLRSTYRVPRRSQRWYWLQVAAATAYTPRTSHYQQATR